MSFIDNATDEQLREQFHLLLQPDALVILQALKRRNADAQIYGEAPSPSMEVTVSPSPSPSLSPPSPPAPLQEYSSESELSAPEMTPQELAEFRLVNKKRPRSGHHHDQGLVPKRPVPSTNNNRFAGLAVDEIPIPPRPPSDNNPTPGPSRQPNNTIVTTNIPGTKPINSTPPIVIRTKENWPAIAKSLTDKGVEITSGKTVASGINVHVATPSDYRQATKILEKNKTPFHSYSRPEDITIKAVIRGLPAETPIEDIKAALMALKFQPISIYQMKNFRTKLPMPLVRIELARNEFNKDISTLVKLHHLIVSVEPARKPRVVTQCHRCQKFNHSAYNCRAPPKCVKCGEDHFTADCSRKVKTLDPAPKCPNCGGPHPGSYRGCPSFPKLSKPQSTVRPAHNSFPSGRPANSYASTLAPPIGQISGNANQNAAPAPTTSSWTTIIQKLLQINISQLISIGKDILTALCSANSFTDLIPILTAKIPEILQLFTQSNG